MRYFIKTYGCQMNESDSERIASFLENRGYKPIKGADLSAEALAKADLIVVNACSVRQTAIDRIFGLKPKIRKLQKTNPKLQTILTGCVLKSDKKKFENFFDKIVDIDSFFNSHIFSDREKKAINYLSLKPKHKNKKSAFVPIMTGCDNFCSYCVVPYVRGREISRKPEEIIKEVKDLVKKGYKEITLLGQNVNSFKGEIKNKKQKIKNTNKKLKIIGFPKLLKLIDEIPGKFTIKFLTNHPKDFSDELINVIAKSKKIAKEIHLPIQSGDNQILKKMNRGYTVEQYKKLIKKIQKKIPDVKISTDVIVGFPGETKKQFENTVKLFKQIKFDKAYINKYSTRPGTAAAKLKDNISWNEKKRRWKILNDLVKEKPKLIIILGPTASGKSEMAIKIAKDFNGEIISADSRQVYKEMNIGTGKITPDTKNSSNFSTGQVKNKYIFTHKGIPHHCIDIASPKKQITVTEYRKKALEAIDKKNKIPILCGGTGFYIQAVVESGIPEIKPDQKLRKKLEKKTTKQLFNQLKKLDAVRAKNIDSKNKRRLVRALEIVLKTKQPVPSLKSEPRFNVLYIGIKKSLPELKKSINQRVDEMIKNGLEREIKKLVEKYGWTQVLKNAIGYQEFYKLSTFNVESLIKLHTHQFAKRQLTWFKKQPGKKVNWIKTYPQAKKLIEKFINS